MQSGHSQSLRSFVSPPVSQSGGLLATDTCEGIGAETDSGFTVAGVGISKDFEIDGCSRLACSLSAESIRDPAEHSTATPNVSRRSAGLTHDVTLGTGLLEAVWPSFL